MLTHSYTRPLSGPSTDTRTLAHLSRARIGDVLQTKTACSHVLSRPRFPQIEAELELPV